MKALSHDIKNTSCIDAHGCEMSFFASQNASGAKKVCFLMLYEFARVCEAHFFMPGRRQRKGRKRNSHYNVVRNQRQELLMRESIGDSFSFLRNSKGVVMLMRVK